MPIAQQKITPCLWFDTEAEAAANHYVSIFKNSKIVKIGRYGKEGKEVHGKEAGSVMAVDFELEGQKFVGLNGGPKFKFDEAISFQIGCETQAEIDYFWSKLTDGGKEVQCGWLKDKFGLSWQVVPRKLPELLGDTNPDKAGRVMKAMLQMKKFDIAALRKAAALAGSDDQSPIKGESHARPSLPDLQRPLRGSHRVLQEGDRRQGRDDDALQGRSHRPQMRARHREQHHALVSAH